MYLQQLRQRIKEHGKESLVYIDESGFEEHVVRLQGWAEKGRKTYGSQWGCSRKRTNLIVAKCREKLLAPVLFEGSTKADWFNHWLKECLFKELPENATVIMDNAAFHKTAQTKQLFDDSPYNLLYLPPYSPDFNPVETVFANLKKRKQFAPPNTSLDSLVNMYNSYLE